MLGNYNVPAFCRFRLLSEYSLVVCLELRDTLIGQRWLGHLLDYLVGNRCDVRSGQCAVSYMNGLRTLAR